MMFAHDDKQEEGSMHIIYIYSPVLMIKQPFGAAIKLREYSSTKIISLTIFRI